MAAAAGGTRRRCPSCRSLPLRCAPSRPWVVDGPAEREASVQQVARGADAEQEDEAAPPARRPGDGRADDEDQQGVEDVRELPAGVEPGLVHATISCLPWRGYPETPRRGHGGDLTWRRSRSLGAGACSRAAQACY